MWRKSIIATVCLSFAVFGGCGTPQSARSESPTPDSSLDFANAPEGDQVLGRSIVEDPRHTPTLALDYPDVLEFRAADEIVVGGSPRFAALVEQWGRGFNRAGYAGRIAPNQAATARSIEHYCSSYGSDLLVLARRPAAAEMALCANHGREMVTLQIGYDRIVVAVSDENYWLDGVTAASLERVISADTWSGIELGMPARPVSQQLPTTTRDLWLAVQGNLVNDAALVANDATLHSFDNEMVGAVAADRDSLTIISYASYLAVNNVGTKLLHFDGMDPATAPDYPLVQDVFIVVDRSELGSNEPLAVFVAFVLNRLHWELPALGLSPLRQRAADDLMRGYVELIGEASPPGEPLPIRLQESEDRDA